MKRARTKLPTTVISSIMAMTVAMIMMTLMMATIFLPAVVAFTNNGAFDSRHTNARMAQSSSMHQRLPSPRPHIPSLPTRQSQGSSVASLPSTTPFDANSNRPHTDHAVYSPLFRDMRTNRRPNPNSSSSLGRPTSSWHAIKSVGIAMSAVATTTLFRSPRSAWASASAVSSEATPSATSGLVASTAQLIIKTFAATSRSIKSRIRRTSTTNLVLTAFTAAYLASCCIASIRTRRRQKDDATSEWGRYSQQPAARGGAIVMLLLDQCMLYVASKLSQLLRMKQRRQNIRDVAGARFAERLLKLGPLYIKLGQILSCQDSIFGKEWLTAMERLQDRVPARTGEKALELAYSSLEGGKEDFDRLFSSFDSNPLAAASLGQVHRATLRESGDEVAVKIQRPNLKEIYDQDFVLLTTIAKTMDKIPTANKNVGGGVQSSWTKIFEDAEDILYREIDYRDEASNSLRISRDFGIGKGGQPMTPTAQSRNGKTLPSAAEWIRIPWVYEDLTSQRMLVMEYVPSIKITNLAKLDEANISAEQRTQLADNLARAYLRQFCCNLFFSTDPHPGNLGVELGAAGTNADGTGEPRLVLYDFGQSASLSLDQADGILGIIKAIIDTDVDRSMVAFDKMGVLVDGADLEMVRAKIADNYKKGKIKANRKKLKRQGYVFKQCPVADRNVNDDETTETQINGSVNGDVNLNATAGEAAVSTDESNTEANAAATLAKSGEWDSSSSSTSSQATPPPPNDMKVMSYFTLPAEYAFVARAISQMTGVGKTLDPEFDFISSAAPYIVEIEGVDKYLKEETRKVVMNLQKQIVEFQTKLLGRRFEEYNRRDEKRMGGNMMMR